MSGQLIFTIIVLIACAGAGIYFFVIKKKSSSSTPAPTPSSGWQFQYSSNVNGSPEDFDFPNQDGVHYCVKAPPPLPIGKVVTLDFTLSGSGTLVPVQGTTATISLYIQRQGDNLTGAGVYQQYRYFHSGIPLVIGTSNLAVPLNADQWSDVFGSMGTEHQDAFLACLANAGAIGFVFGDPRAGATGHGVYANGPVHFHLNQFTVT